MKMEEVAGSPWMNVGNIWKLDKDENYPSLGLQNGWQSVNIFIPYPWDLGQISDLEKYNSDKIMSFKDTVIMLMSPIKISTTAAMFKIQKGKKFKNLSKRSKK